IDAAKQAGQIWIATGIVARDGVLDRDGHTVLHQPTNRVESFLGVVAEAVLGLEIENERKARGLRDFAQPGFHARGIARVAARQHHRAAKRIAAEEARLIDRAAEGRTDTWNRPALSAKPG